MVKVPPRNHIAFKPTPALGKRVDQALTENFGLPMLPWMGDLIEE
jgi:hypothetical protein